MVTAVSSWRSMSHHLLLLLFAPLSLCCSRRFEVSLQEPTAWASGGACYPLCPVVTLEQGVNTSYDGYSAATFPQSTTWSPELGCPEVQGLPQDWCLHIPYSNASGTQDIAATNGLSFLYDGDNVCTQMMKSKAVVRNASGELSAEVFWSLERACAAAEEGELLADFRFMLWDLSRVGGEDGGACDVPNYWLSCDDSIVRSVRVWGGTSHASASARLILALLVLTTYTWSNM